MVDALGAPHLGEQSEKELIASFVERDGSQTACDQVVGALIKEREGTQWTPSRKNSGRAFADFWIR
jgi:hypothetical protein